MDEGLGIDATAGRSRRVDSGNNSSGIRGDGWSSLAGIWDEEGGGEEVSDEYFIVRPGERN